MTTFYSVAYLLFVLAIKGRETMDSKDIIQSLLPIFCNKYWFITSYLMVMLVSNYLEKLLDIISKEQFKLLILALSLFVVIAPSLFLVEIFKDSGKGFVNMLLVYLAGRYFAKYDFPVFVKRLNVIVIFLCVMTIWLLNEILNSLGMPSLFARDNNILIIMLSISIFYTFLSLPEKNNILMITLSKYVLPLYILHLMFFREICLVIYDRIHVEAITQIPISIICVIVISLFIEFLRRKVLIKAFESVDVFLASKIETFTEAYV